MITEEYCTIKFMHICFVFSPAWSLNLWQRCFGYIFSIKALICGKLLITDDATMNTNSFISKFCSSTDGTNLSESTSQFISTFGKSWDTDTTLSTTATVLNKCTDIVFCWDVLPNKFEIRQIVMCLRKNRTPQWYFSNIWNVILGIHAEFEVSIHTRTVAIIKHKKIQTTFTYLNDGSIFLSQLSPTNWYLILPPFSQSVRSFIIASSKLSFHEHNFLWTELEVTHCPILASLSISYEFKHSKF